LAKLTFQVTGAKAGAATVTTSMTSTSVPGIAVVRKTLMMTSPW
jgi:hypothetical protein